MQLKFREIAGFLIASRVPNLIILGYVQFGTAFFLMNKPLEKVFTFSFGLLILSTAMIGAAGYVINDYFDQKIDMINRPHKVVIGEGLRRRIAIVIHFLLSTGAIGFGLIVDPSIAFIHLFSTIALLLYSSSLKRILLIDTVTISFLTSLTLIIVLVFFKELKLLVVAYALFGGLAVFVRESMKDIISSKGDSTFGVNSISSAWGISGAKVIIYIACALGTIGLSYYMYRVPNWSIRYFFIGLFVFIGWFIYKLYKADRTKDFLELKFYIDTIIITGLVSIFFS